MRNRPFSLIGVNSDPNLKAVSRGLSQIPWRNFWNGPEGIDGPISSLWNVKAWPTIYVVDHKGIIQAKNPKQEELDGIVEKLVAAAEKDGASAPRPSRVSP